MNKNRIEPVTLNGARVKRWGEFIFVALPPHAWTPIPTFGAATDRPAYGCGCFYCREGAAQVYDTLVIDAEGKEGETREYARVCHYPEFSQKAESQKPHCIDPCKHIAHERRQR